jgi:hypothetical protein
MTANIHSRLTRHRQQLSDLRKRIGTARRTLRGMMADYRVINGIIGELEAILAEPAQVDSDDSNGDSGASNAAVILQHLAEHPTGSFTVDDLLEQIGPRLRSAGSKRNLISTTLYNAKKKSKVFHDERTQTYKHKPALVDLDDA